MVAPYPVASLRRVSRTGAALESLLARWTCARAIGPKVAAQVGAPARVQLVRVIEQVIDHVDGRVIDHAPGAVDPFAALAEVRLHGQSFLVGGSSAFARELAQRRLFGPDELAAPRPLTQVEHAVFAGLVAAALVDANIAGEVWPVVDADRARARLNSPISSAPPGSSEGPFRVELALVIEGRAPVTVVVACPPALRVASPPERPLPGWQLDVPVLVGSCALHRDAVGRLAPRDVITLDRHLGLALGDGLVPLSAAPGAVEARVTSDYVRRDMALPDDAHLELTVQLGTTRLSLRQLSDLVPGSIVALGRPLAGPFEVRVAGRLVGEGELVDVDGELGVRMVSVVSLQE